MGECTRNCSNGCCEVAVMEVAQAVDNSGSAKRRKVVGNGESRLSSSKAVRITGEDMITTSKKGENLSNHGTDATSFSFGDVPASCCSSSGSITDKVKCPDLELQERDEIERKRKNSDRRESKLTSELKEESGELESKSAVMIDSRSAIPAEKKPPAAEIEDFFAAAEKDLQKRFKDEYNYDIVKDVPLKGRFEWVELKP